MLSPEIRTHDARREQEIPSGIGSFLAAASRVLGIVLDVDGPSSCGWGVRARSEDNPGLTLDQIVSRVRKLRGELARKGHDVDAVRSWGRGARQTTHGARFWIYA